MSNYDLNYRPDIDGLRAIAVLSVVGFHVFPTLIKGGFIGVDIFFVISGFLISSIILNNLTNDNFNIFRFYSRRIKRIFPALLITLLVCLIVGWFILFPHEFAQLGKHVLSGAGFFSNFTFWSEAGYFDNLAETKPLLHLWSLGIEEQYYIIWPLLLYLIWKKPRIIPFVLLIIFIVSLTLNISVVHRDLVAAFYSPQTRFWELVAGSLLAYFIFKKQVSTAVPAARSCEQDTEHSLARGTVNKPAALYKNRLTSGKTLFQSASYINKKYYILQHVSSLMGFILLGISLLFINKTKIFPGWWAILPNIGTLLIILAGPRAWFNKVILSNRILIWIGLISFPLYLWHWPILSFAFILKGDHIGIKAGLMIILISIMFAWGTYSFVEKPIRLNQKNFIVYLLILIMLVIALMGFYCNSKEGFLNRPFWKNFNEVNAQFVGPAWQYTQNDTCLNRYPFDEAKDYRWWFCMTNKNKKPTVILLGNSFANQLYPGLLNSKLFSNETILSIGTCDAAKVDKTKSVDISDPAFPCAGERPIHQEKFINNIIKQNVGSLKYAIIAGLFASPSEDYISRLKRKIDFLEKNHIKVIIFLPHLLFNKDVKSCIRPFSRSTGCISDLKERNSLTQLSQSVIKAISKTNPNVVFFDPNDLFCDSKKCSMTDTNGLPFYRDQLHLSEYGSIKLIDLFEKQSEKNLSKTIITQA
ncbi:MULTISPECIES: acyltransferase family protein [Legionella]|uniref:Acyltransferase n=1 Tax=Legionella resiliens TaxID=2905958 RepID=A0ABS8X1Y2_9GAMM|nr:MULTISPECIES: acyltransferase family protein [unclassified Legionella]MCE0723596.1 acyltransferase [Legionella sp. 9fVS26]MCE3532750.1 acyltransferase [Legionella sp. 8cVS16]QLZ68885.1 acyltransferase [Legionella sp. PC1000]